MIEVINVTKKYGNNVAVDNLNFKVEKGKIYGFLGPNGAGKSTTMNIITGCLAATEGTVKVDGHDIFEEPREAKKLIGYLPEIPPLYTDFTPFEYLNFVADAKKIPSGEKFEKIEEVMNKTKITNVANRLIKNLSKGYKQRVGIAQAMLGNPEIIILDEPTVGLDPKQIIEIRNLIKELSENHTVILSSHILSEVQAVCDYAIIISHGRVVASDTIENLENGSTEYTDMKLILKSTPDKVSAIVDEFEEISHYSIMESKDGTEANLVVMGNVDLREKLYSAFSDAGIVILEMTTVKPSLEEIYLKLTDDLNNSDYVEDDSTKFDDVDGDNDDIVTPDTIEEVSVDTQNDDDYSSPFGTKEDN